MVSEDEEIARVEALGSGHWVVVFKPRNPLDEAMGGGPIFHVSARTKSEAIRKARIKLTLKSELALKRLRRR